MKERLKNNILVKMSRHCTEQQVSILESILVYELQGVEIQPTSDLPATVDNTNDYIMDLFRVKKAPKLSDNTVVQYENTLKNFLLVIDKPLTMVTITDIEYYLHEYHKRGNSNVSCNIQLSYLRAFFTFMRKNGLIVQNPAECIEKYKTDTKPIDHMQAEEVEQLKTGCKHKRDRALIEFLRCTAMRGGEVPLVKVRDVDFKQGRILIYGKKGRTYRPVCLDGIALKYLEDYIESRGIDKYSDEPLFTHLRGNKTIALNRGGMLTSVKEIAKRAGMHRNVYIHLFRKTTATNIVKRGGSDEIAGEYLGHKPRTVTGNHYTYKSEDHIVSIFNKFVQAV